MKSIDLKISVGIGEAYFDEGSEASDLGKGKAYEIVFDNYDKMEKDWYFTINTDNQVLNSQFGSILNTINHNLKSDQALLDQVITVIDEGRYKNETYDTINKKNIHQHAKEILNGLYTLSHKLQEYILNIRHIEQLGIKKIKEVKYKNNDSQEKGMTKKGPSSERKYLQKNKIGKNSLKHKKNKKSIYIQKKIRCIKIISILMALIIASLVLLTINYLIHWEWLIEHPNSYGLQGCIFFCIIFLIIGVFVKQWRKILWIAGISFIGILLQLLGGPS